MVCMYLGKLDGFLHDDGSNAMIILSALSVVEIEN